MHWSCTGKKENRKIYKYQGKGCLTFHGVSYQRIDMVKQMTKILDVLKSIYNLLEKKYKVTEVDTVLTEADVKQWMTRMAVIDRLGISERTYNRWVKSKILVPIKMGNKHFYREEDLKVAVRHSINKGLI